MVAQYKSFLHKISLAFVAIVLAIIIAVVPVKAAEYNCGTYSAGVYQNNVCGASTTTDDTSLANTGQSIWPILLAVLLILIGTIMLYRTRKKMKARTSQNL